MAARKNTRWWKVLSLDTLKRKTIIEVSKEKFVRRNRFQLPPTSKELFSVVYPTSIDHTHSQVQRTPLFDCVCKSLSLSLYVRVYVFRSHLRTYILTIIWTLTSQISFIVRKNLYHPTLNCTNNVRFVSQWPPSQYI